MDKSKYAELPGIAVGEPDVYETNDLPEVDQLSSRPACEDQSDCVQIITTGVGDAYKRFGSAKVDVSSETDFSQTGFRKLRGYRTFNDGIWEIAAQGETESPLQRYHRLQAETHQLLEELKSSKVELSESEKKDNKLSCVQLVKKLESLDNELTNLNLNDWIDVTSKSQDKISERHKDHAIRQKLDTNETHLNILEQRIRRLETVLGNDEQKLSFLTSLTNEKSLFETINVMSSKVCQLDPTHLEHIDARLHSIISKLTQISERKIQIDDLEKQNKISELYDLVNKSSDIRSSIPNLLFRLETLKDLHVEALQFSGAISYLDNLQQRLLESIETNEKDLTDLKNSFDKNSESIKSLLADFDKRIQALK